LSKFLLLILVIVVVWRLVQRLPRRDEGGATPQAAPEQMVNCEHCGLYLPRSEAVGEDGRYFCCVEHRRLAG
jgi:uncharacterized protein